MTMHLVRRNLRTVYYCLLDHREKIYDSDGNWTGEWKNIYADPVPAKMVVGPARGYVHGDFYGRLPSDDRTVVSADITLPIDTSTMMYVDRSPQTDLEGHPCGFDYSVRRVAKMLNSVSYILMEVKTG